MQKLPEYRENLYRNFIFLIFFICQNNLSIIRLLYKDYLKRPFDFIISLIVLIALLPLLLLIIILLFFMNNGKPFFIQSRPGKNDKVICVIKFRTMNEKKDNKGLLLPDKDRITTVGRILRVASLDELPQFYNVLKGDMSLVGPRPLLFKYIPLYDERQRKRNLVRPGITGLAQVSGRNSISWKEKFDFDIYYVENISFLMDLRLLLKTLVQVIKGNGINQSELRPMMPFDGNN